MNAVAVATPGPRLLGRRGPWLHGDFFRLFAAQTVSLFGSEITLIALPLTAALTLDATPAQMGLLAAVGKVPYVLFGLLAGVWVDRLSCRSVLVATDFGRAVLLGSIPLAAVAGVLRIEHLFVVALLAGVLTVFFDVAYQSYLPELVERDHLADGNSKLEASKSLAEMAGPMLGSVLLQIAAAPFAIGVDALSFLFSGLFLRSIRTSVARANTRARAGVLSEVRVGVSLVLRHSILRSIAACSASMNLFYQMLAAVYILYVTTELQLPPAAVGIIFGLGSVAGLAGALVASPAATRFGLGKTLIASTLVSGLGGLAVAFVHGSDLLVIAALTCAQLLLTFGIPLYNINQLSMRQAITPPGLRGRVSATNRCLVWGTMPIGSLLGGALGEVLGLEATIAIAGLGMLLSCAWLIASPVRTLTAETVAALPELS